MRKIISRLALVPALLAATLARADLPQASPVPGGITILTLAADNMPAPRVRFEGKRVLLLRAGGSWQAVVGLPLSLKPGPHTLQVDNRSVPFNVEPKSYETQRLTIRNKRQVDPNASDLERIGREQQIMNAAFSTWTDSVPDNLVFDVPAKGPFSSRFGLRRVLNNQPRAPHSGLDIAVPEGTPVLAPATGTVIETGNYFFTGNTIFLDHGQGLVSMYIHLSRLDVTKGDHVARGQLIGAVGKTGRTTGAHLHWAVSLNNARVDPMLFLPSEIRAQARAPAVAKPAAAPTGPARGN